MNIIALMGSPRKNSNTVILLDEMIKGVTDAGHNVTKDCVSELNVSACKACGTCMSGRDCILDDDALKITHEIAEAEALIVAAPIYYGQMTGELKILIDRFYGITHNPLINLSGKVMLIFTHLGPEGYYDPYIDLMKIQPFHMNMHYEVAGVLDVGNLGNVYNQPDKLTDAYNMGKNFMI